MLNLGILDLFRNKTKILFHGLSKTHTDDHLKFRICTCHPISVKFILKTIKDRGNLLTKY